MIRVEGLTKRFGRLTAVKDISFEIGRGEIVGLLGPNGAGKTTTLRILSTFLPPTSGSVVIDGLDISRDPIGVRRKIGYLPEQVPLYNEMRVSEYLAYRGRLKDLTGGLLRQRIEQVLESCHLTEVRRSIIGTLSKGYRQRVGLADSLIHEPDFLILDEPTIGLDPSQVRAVRELIRGLATSHTVLLSSHILSEVEMMCSRVMILKEGSIVTSDTTANLVTVMQGHPRLTLEVQAEKDPVAARLREVPGILNVQGTSTGAWTRLVCDYEKTMDPRTDIFALMAENGWTIRELRTEKRSLEDAFLEMTSRPEVSVDATEGDAA